MTTPAEHLLIVDDDPVICDLVKLYLSEEGYRVSAVQNGTDMRHVLAEHVIDLVILDLIMPGEDGLTLTRYINEHSNTAVIILTTKNATVDRIVGLEMGADDYVTKPFDERELLARVRSVLRRRSKKTIDADNDNELSGTWVRFSGWRLNRDTCQLYSPDGEETPLTTGEFDLLSAFIDHPNRTLSRDQLLNLTRNRDAGPFDRSVDVQIGRLRRKIETDPAHPTLIITVRGLGYRFTPKVEKLKSPAEGG